MLTEYSEINRSEKIKENHVVVSHLLKLGYGWILNDENSNLPSIDRLVEKVTEREMMIARREEAKQEMFAQYSQEITKLQAITRGHVLRRRLNVLHSVAIVLQKLYRGYVSRMTSEERLISIVKIQSNVRGYALRKNLRMVHKEVTIIQKNYRRHKARQYAQFEKRNLILLQSLQKKDRTEKGIGNLIIRIQAIARGSILRKKFRMYKENAIIIQSTIRGNISRNRTDVRNEKAIIIQKTYKRYEVMKKEGAIRKVQATVRGYLLRRRFEQITEKIEIIQKLCRKYLARQNFISFKTSIILIQRAYLKGKEKKEIQKLNRIIKLQSLARGYFLRDRLQVLNDKASLIQDLFRGYRLKSKYQSQSHNIVLIQRAYRKKRFEGDTKEVQNSSIIIIQCHSRGYLCRSRLLLLNNLVTSIQKVYKGYILRNRLQRLNNFVTLIQTAYRGYLLRRIYRSSLMNIINMQSMYRQKKIGNDMKKKKLKSSIAMQSIARRHLVHQRFKKLSRRKGDADTKAFVTQ